MAWPDDESLGIPASDPGMSAPGRRRGLWATLAALAQPQQEETAQASASPRLRDRVTDDPATRANHEMTGEAYGEGLRQSPIGQSPTQRGSTEDLENRRLEGSLSLADQMRTQQGPQPPSHLDQLQAQYDRLNPAPQPMSLKQKILRGALGAGIGVLAGPQGMERIEKQRDFQQNQNREKSQNLLQQIEAERRMQEQEGLATQRMTLQEQMERDREEAAAAREQPKVVDTDQGPVQWNMRTRQFEPVMVGGQRAGPKAQPKPDTPEQQFIDSPDEQGKTLTQKLTDYARITQKPERSDAADARAAARGDRSYQFNAGRVDKLAAPIEQRAERLSRLMDTLAQGSPQADALVAPELLTVMAGGQGSGLRMNEAEISRIVGGRTVWEGLKAKIDAYQLDPSKGFALTPEQRKQVGALMQAVQQRVNQKMQVLDEERQNLSATDDPMEHRKIVNRLQKRLSETDTTGSGPQGRGQGSQGLTPPRDADAGMKWQHRTTNGKTEWRQVPAQRGPI